MILILGLRALLIIVALYLLISQLIIPFIAGTKLLPLFRPSKLDREVARLEEEKEHLESEARLAERKKQVEKKIAELQSKRPPRK